MSIPVQRYEEALAELPDLLEHLAHLVVPGVHMADGQPRARDLTPAPARLNPCLLYTSDAADDIALV